MKGMIKLWTAATLLCGTIAGCAGATATVAAPAAPVPATAETSAVVVETVVAGAADEGVMNGIDQVWVDFRAERDGFLTAAAATLLECAEAPAKERSPECQRRHDSFEVAYGLSAMYRLTHDPSYLDAADAAIDAKAVKRVSRLEPYDASFFLALATEREQTKHRTDLHKAAQTVATRLEAWISEASDYEFAQRSMFGNEENAALVLARLWDWAELNADDDMRDRLRSLTERRFVGVDMDSWCPQSVDCEPENFEFLPPCLQRASAVLSVLPSTRSNPWLEAFLAKQTELEPMTLSQLDTHQSLNFTRAIGLWRIYEATGEVAYRRKYVEHVNAGMAFLARQDSVDPWHAAFAVHALSMSVEG